MQANFANNFLLLFHFTLFNMCSLVKEKISFSFDFYSSSYMQALTATILQTNCPKSIGPMKFGSLQICILFL